MQENDKILDNFVFGVDLSDISLPHPPYLLWKIHILEQNYAINGIFFNKLPVNICQTPTDTLVNRLAC